MSYFLKRLAFRLLLIAALAFAVFTTPSGSTTTYAACDQWCQYVDGLALCRRGVSWTGNEGCYEDFTFNKCRYRFFCA
jgi:hypothetical protein